MNLIALNRDFYDAFAAEFAESRQRIHPGIQRALEALDASAVLDVGCGDGRVRRILPDGCRYVGLDFSEKLIRRAAAESTPLALAEFSNPLPVASESFASVACFAVLHHLPQRLPLLRELARVAAPGGRIAVSVWQFSHNPRMRRKIVQELGGGDYVLNWERGGHGLRYVHEVLEEELRGLAREAGLRAIETFRSDGRSGDLSLYAILERA